ncbi:MAG: hypothetical protein ACLGI8_04070 [Acidimicrobiia bacterium]
MPTPDAAPAPASPRPSVALRATHKVVVVAIPLLVLVQATLAGQHLFEGSDVITLHGIFGNVTFALTVVGVPLALVARRGDGLAFSLAVALVALTFAQVGLGYVGRETQSAAAWHIPLGVTIFGLAAFQLSTLRTDR